MSHKSRHRNRPKKDTTPTGTISMTASPRKPRSSNPFYSLGLELLDRLNEATDRERYARLQKAFQETHAGRLTGFKVVTNVHLSKENRTMSAPTVGRIVHVFFSEKFSRSLRSQGKLIPLNAPCAGLITAVDVSDPGFPKINVAVFDANATQFGQHDIDLVETSETHPKGLECWAMWPPRV